jgi:aquaporin Z
MAHFNPAVTVGFLITKHITRIQLLYYLTAEIIGALLANLFVKYAIGTEAFLGANSPNYAFPLPLIFSIEILASALLMVVIFVVVYTKGLRSFSGIVIGGIVGLDIFFLAFISGAFMNPARSLAPAVLSGVITNLWLYWTATLEKNNERWSKTLTNSGKSINYHICALSSSGGKNTLLYSLHSANWI